MFIIILHEISILSIIFLEEIKKKRKESMTKRRRRQRTQRKIA